MTEYLRGVVHYFGCTRGCIRILGLLKLLAQFIGAVVLGILGLVLFFWALHLLGAIISFALGVLMLVGFIYLISLLFKIGTKQTQSKLDSSYKVSAMKQPAVALFAAEPSVSQLVNAESMSHVTEWSLNGSIVEVDNDTEVIILDDKREKSAVRIRVSKGQYQGREGWVCRSNLQKSDNNKLLPG